MKEKKAQPKRQKEVELVKVENIKIHPLVSEIRSQRKTDMFKYTLDVNGQENPIHCVIRNGEVYVFDGCTRVAAGMEVDHLDELECIIHDIPDNQIMDKRIRLNQTSKTHLKEKCFYFEHTLGIIGKSQGKKRVLMGFDKIDEDTNFGDIGKDIYTIACHLTGLDLSASTARRLMYIYWLENENEKIKALGLIDKINANEISINKAYGLLKDKKMKEDKKAQRLHEVAQRETITGKYKLFNKSAFNLDFIEDESIDIAPFSPPYPDAMKIYRHQDEVKHGQEKTTEEYIANGMKACNEIKKKLKANGVMAVIINESFKGGYSSVVSRYEIALIANGWEIIGIIQWIKENPTPVRLNEFFQPADEKIIICKKKGGKPYFSHPVKENAGAGEFTIKQSHKSKDGDLRFYIGGDEIPTTNILITPVFNRSEFGDIDPKFKHDAPCPFAVYDKILGAYSRSGMNYLEIFSGSGQGLVSAMKHGLDVIGVEIDPVSIEFTKKRLDHLINERSKNSVKKLAA